ncbi:MAG: menaquinone reductase molybdopterin-binding-like subunit QrcB [Pseudomonadota bacterium]
MALNRRSFLKFVGGATTGIMATPVIWKGLDDVSIWSQNWSWIPRNIYGENSYVPSISKHCPSGEGVMVRLVGGRPVRVLGNPEHPLSQGGLSSIAAAEAQMLYSPARMRRPLKRSADGAYVEVSWEEAGKMLLAGLEAAKGSFACISGDENGTASEMLSAFTKQMGSDDFLLMPSEVQPASKAWELMGGAGQIGYDIEKSDFVLALGANVLESWGTAIRNRHAFNAGRPVGEEPQVKFAYAGPVRNNTAAAVDTWLPVHTGTEVFLALGIAQQLMEMGASAPVSDFAVFKQMASVFTPEKVAALTGISAASITAMAKDLMAAKCPLVIAGSEFEQGCGVAPIMAGIALNMLLGSVNRDGGLRAIPFADKVLPDAMDRKDMWKTDLIAWSAATAAEGAEAPKAILVYDANPSYALPKGDDFAKAYAKASFKVCFATMLNETAKASDLVIPVPMGMERLEDALTPYGCGETVYSVAPAVVEPLFNVRSAMDVFFDLAERLGLSLGAGSFEEMLQAKAEALGADYDSLAEGTAFTSRDVLSAYGMAFRSDVIATAVNGFKAPSETLRLAPFARLNIGTSRTAIPPFNIKTVRRWELQGTMNYVMVNGATARKLGLKQHDTVVLSNEAGKVTVKINITETIANNTVGMLLGFGHTAFDQFSKGKGVNVMQLLAPKAEPGTGMSVWTSTGVNIAKA